MAQIAEVAEDNVIHVDDIDRVATLLLPMLVVVIGGDACDQHIADLVFARPSHHIGFTPDPHDIVVTGVVMADGDDRGVALAQSRRLPLRGAMLGENGSVTSRTFLPRNKK